MTTQDEHGYPFQTEWEKHQAEPLPEFKKPKERLPIGKSEMQPLNTEELNDLPKSSTAFKATK